MPAAKYRRKVTGEVEALQWDGNADEMQEFVQAVETGTFIEGEFVLYCKNGDVLRLIRGMWVVKDAKGNFTRWYGSNFQQEFEPVPAGE